MEELLLILQERLKEQIPELLHIDEDCGQLQALFNGEDRYPLTFPCVLLGDINTTWSKKTPFVQMGVSSITVRLAFNCFDDTHYGSGTTHKIRERYGIDKRIYKCLQGYRKDKEMGRLSRTKSVAYSLPKNIKVYESVYEFEIIDQTAAQTDL